MAVKHKNLYLYLTLACLLGIVLIFIFDGYMGVYDTLSITAGEFTQEITVDQWVQQARYGYLPTTNVEWDGKVGFTYQVDNRLFSVYTAEISVSVWHAQEKVRDLVTQRLIINSFGNGQLTWVLDPAQLLPANANSQQSYQYTVEIQRGEVVRKVIVYVSPTLSPPKGVIPAPTG